MSITSDQEKSDGLGQETLPNRNPQPARRKISMALVNFWLDAGLFVAFLLLIWTSTVLEFIFPPPTSAAGWKLWGMSFNQWRDAQYVILCICSLLALEHLVLHWNWVCSVIMAQVLRAKSKLDEGQQAIYGVGTFVVILFSMLGGLVAALISLKAPPVP